MTVQAACPTIVTRQLAEARRFYAEHFNAHVSFDCGWYVVLRLSGPDGPELCLMEPRHGMPEFSGGATLNLRVADADATHARLTGHGLEPSMPLADHPWGDRGFAISDPCGLRLYCYHPIAPSEEFKQYIR
jgi:uncharacterized glyoxalase superfamily protein PhnB